MTLKARLRHTADRVDNEQLRSARRLVRQARRGDLDVLYLGDSTTEWVGPRDTDRRALWAMLGDGLDDGTAYATAYGGSYSVEIFDAYLKLVSGIRLPRLVVLPLCYRLRFAPWRLHPVYSRARATEYIAGLPADVSSRRLLRGFPRPAPEEWQRYHELPWRTLAEYDRVGDYVDRLKNARFAQEHPAARQKLIYAYHQTHEIDPHDDALRAVRRLGETLRSLDRPVVVYETPVSVATGRQHWGDRFAEIAAGNFATQRDALCDGYGADVGVLRTGEIFGADEFIDPAIADEHLNERGRRRLAGLVLDRVRTLEPSLTRPVGTAAEAGRPAAASLPAGTTGTAGAASERGDGVRRLRDRGLWYAFRAGQRVGVDVTPHHFYSNTPDLRRLRDSDAWRAPRSMHGVQGTDLADQRAELERWVPAQLTDRLTSTDVYADACAENGAIGYGPIEANLLYAFMSTQRPRRVVQIGSGVATAVMLRAKREHDLDTTIVCVDPYPTAFLQDAAARQDIELLAEPAQQVDAAVFESLTAADLLFIDSTHTVKVGSEVNRLILDVLPALASGVFVHFHDIYFPYDHGPEVLTGEIFFWNESTLLHAFLAGNSRVTVRVSGSMLHHGAPDALRRAFPRYRPRATPDGVAAAGSSGDFPSATYLQVL